MHTNLIFFKKDSDFQVGYMFFKKWFESFAGLIKSNMLRTKVSNDNDAILSPFNLQVYKNGGFQTEVSLAV